jgi:hypothetical protein
MNVIGIHSVVSEWQIRLLHYAFVLSSSYKARIKWMFCFIIFQNTPRN